MLPEACIAFSNFLDELALPVLHIAVPLSHVLCVL